MYLLRCYAVTGAACGMPDGVYLCFENSAPTLPLCDRLLRLRRLLLGLNGDDIAQTLQPALEVGGGAGLIELIKIRLAELAIADAAAEHVIGCDQDLVRNRQRRAHGTATGLETVILVAEVTALGVLRRHRRADQDRAQVHVALAGGGALVLSVNLMAAREKSGPGGEVVDG